MVTRLSSCTSTCESKTPTLVVETSSDAQDGAHLTSTSLDLPSIDGTPYADMAATSQPHDGDTTAGPVSMMVDSLVSDASKVDLRSILNPPLPEYREGDVQLPPYGELCALLDLYFKHINTWCPILDRNVMFEILSHYPAIEGCEHTLLCIVAATALRFAPDVSLTREDRDRHYAMTKQKVIMQALEHPSTQALQALLILALDVLGTVEGPSGCNILALVGSIAKQLRLHMEHEIAFSATTSEYVGALSGLILPEPTSWREDEGRRRLFWMVYIMERYAGVGTNAPFMIDDDEVYRKLPCRYDLFSRNEYVQTRWAGGTSPSNEVIDHPENMGSFSYHCEIMQIMSRIQTFWSRKIDICSLIEVEHWHRAYGELDSELNAWLSHLPADFGNVSQLCHSDPTSKISNWIILQAAFVTAVVRLHAGAAYPAVTSHIFLPSYSASQKCLAAVSSLEDIAQDALRTGMMGLVGPHFAFSLWVAARLRIVHAACTNDGTEPDVENLIIILNRMGEFWPVAHRYAQLLDSVLRRSASSTSEGLAAMRR